MEETAATIWYVYSKRYTALFNNNCQKSFDTYFHIFLIFISFGTFKIIGIYHFWILRKQIAIQE